MVMEKPVKILKAYFFQTDSGNQPVRNWLKSLELDERMLIGADIMSVEYGWPIGMPTVKYLCDGLWEVRTNLDNKIARVLFRIDGEKMILLHGFIKKTQKTPKGELDLALSRFKMYGGNK
jgi:phage-related protein